MLMINQVSVRGMRLSKQEAEAPQSSAPKQAKFAHCTRRAFNTEPWNIHTFVRSSSFGPSAKSAFWHTGWGFFSRPGSKDRVSWDPELHHEVISRRSLHSPHLPGELITSPKSAFTHFWDSADLWQWSQVTGMIWLRVMFQSFRFYHNLRISLIVQIGHWQISWREIAKNLMCLQGTQRNLWHPHTW